MYSQEGYTQLTFHYIDGRSESFTVYEPIEDAASPPGLNLEVRHLLEKDWWIINLEEQTVFINIDNVVKVEVKPAIPDLRGEGVFSNADQVTTINRMR